MQRVTITSHYCALCLSLAWFWGYLQWVTTRYRQICKNICINIFSKKLTVTHVNLLQIAQKPGKSGRNCSVTRVVTRVVMRSSCGNALHYGLSMFAEFHILAFSNLSFIQISQVFVLNSLDFIK